MLKWLCLWLFLNDFYKKFLYLSTFYLKYEASFKTIYLFLNNWLQKMHFFGNSCLVIQQITCNHRWAFSSEFEFRKILNPSQLQVRVLKNV